MLRKFLQSRQGHVLVQAIITLLIGGITAYYVVHTDILPGLRDKWEAQNSSIQNDWTR